jgi:hypothetical protein
LPPRKQRLTAGAVTTKRCVAKNVIPPRGDATQARVDQIFKLGHLNPGGLASEAPAVSSFRV